MAWPQLRSKRERNPEKQRRGFYIIMTTTDSFDGVSANCGLWLWNMMRVEYNDFFCPSGEFTASQCHFCSHLSGNKRNIIDCRSTVTTVCFTINCISRPFIPGENCAAGRMNLSWVPGPQSLQQWGASLFREQFPKNIHFSSSSIAKAILHEGGRW